MVVIMVVLILHFALMPLNVCYGFRWNGKNGEALIRLSDRVIILHNSILQINQAMRTDTGRYTCLASNLAGKRESIPALLTVKPKPII